MWWARNGRKKGEQREETSGIHLYHFKQTKHNEPPLSLPHTSLIFNRHFQSVVFGEIRNLLRSALIQQLTKSLSLLHHTKTLTPMDLFCVKLGDG